MKFNVILDKEQLEEIANITADKVLATVEYQKSNEAEKSVSLSCKSYAECFGDCGICVDSFCKFKRRDNFWELLF